MIVKHVLIYNTDIIERNENLNKSCEIDYQNLNSDDEES